MSPAGEKRVKIVSNGRASHTDVFVDGERLDYVTAVEWRLNASDGIAEATLHVFDVELVADMKMELRAEAEESAHSR